MKDNDVFSFIKNFLDNKITHYVVYASEFSWEFGEVYLLTAKEVNDDLYDLKPRIDLCYDKSNSNKNSLSMTIVMNKNKEKMNFIPCTSKDEALNVVHDVIINNLNIAKQYTEHKCINVVKFAEMFNIDISDWTKENMIKCEENKIIDNFNNYQNELRNMNKRYESFVQKNEKILKSRGLI